ncbi:pyridoxamine 5'-phosphate oxidase family protein [Streptomyces sp. NPDC046909]|uniref:helix-turn-helix domain-containing protein n=1 Tax=Streptomyces sp. NPDC046909 TaxID=3155617 RepID=UPI0033D9E709
MIDETAPDTAHKRAQGDLGRRLARRRAELGLTQRETARRAGIAPGYLQYVEEVATAAPSVSVLIRLADALSTTVTALTGGSTDLPPGLHRAARDPGFVELAAEECWTRLATHGVGRLAVSTAEGPVVVPVNYSVVDGVIAFRTAPGTVPSQAVGDRVALEVDRIDDVFARGWSVLVCGRARAVTDPYAVRRLADRAYSTPWAGGRRDLWVCVDPEHVTGRAITEGSSYGG